METKQQSHRMIGVRCIVRTYSAGVHFGTVVYAKEGTGDVELENACRLWKWEGGGLSLSGVNRDGMRGGRVDVTGRVYLTDAIELIPTTEAFENSWRNYVE